MTVFWVVVLGDFGRSPRMQYHTLSLIEKSDTSVYVLAYPGSVPIQPLVNAENLTLVPFPEPPKWIRKLPRLAALLLKVILQLLQLLWLMLVKMPRPSSILLQNPPAIPTLAMCSLAAWRHGAKLVVDWHNYGYTILALGMRPGHWLVKLAKSHEKFWGKRGHQHFCVTKAMQQDLRDNWGIQAHVLHDRPPSFFKRTSLPETHDLFARLETSLADPTFHDFLSKLLNNTPPKLQSTPSKSDRAALPVGDTIVTSCSVAGDVCRKPGGPALVVSSTSWTPDEDFSILLEAALIYDKLAAQQKGALPDVLFLITGRGPQRDMYLEKLRSMTLKHVAFRSLWLEAADYPLLLGACDVGVSLHASSSGLDLPMKVVDMYGSGLPVCALSYSCIDELVTDGETGLLFSNAQQLADNLQTLLAGFPNQISASLTKLQNKVASTQQSLRWDENWVKVAWPVLKPK